MTERRKIERERCFAKALFPEMAAYGYISDVSPEGILVRIPGDPPRLLEGKQELKISIEELEIPPFVLEAEYRWVRQEVRSTLVGFRIVNCVDEAGQRGFDALISRFAATGERSGPTGDGSEGIFVA